MKKIYLTKDLQLEGDKYTVICEKHSTLVTCPTRDLAQKTRTVDFCKECR